MRATTISSVNFTIVSFTSRWVARSKINLRSKNSTGNSRSPGDRIYITANFLSNAPMLTDGHDASPSTNREVGCGVNAFTDSLASAALLCARAQYARNRVVLMCVCVYVILRAFIFEYVSPYCENNINPYLHNPLVWFVRAKNKRNNREISL